MTKVYVVQHVRSADDSDADTKLIGVFESQSAAEAAVEQLRQSQGFSAYPHGFSVDGYEVNQIHWLDGFGPE